MRSTIEQSRAKQVSDAVAPNVPAVRVNTTAGGFVRAQLQRRDVQRLIANLVIIAVIGTYVHVQTGLFWTASNWQAISVQIAVVTIVAVAMTLVMIAGHIDASIGGVVV